ncbi:MAG: hypothetical protein RLY24_842 [Actinomycetota bacterium]
MTGRRAQIRAENVSSIKAHARLQIAEKGANNLSLREIARDMGLASSALYRYFESRDQLLTELIVDSYDQIGLIVETADASCERDDLIGRWTAMAHAIRQWALDYTSDYALIFGTPVPGYAAPDTTVEPGRRYTNALLQLLHDVHENSFESKMHLPSTKGIIGEYKKVQSHLGLKIPNDLLMSGLAAWAALFGAISFEVFGHVDSVFTNPEIHFVALTQLLGTQVMGLSH